MKKYENYYDLRAIHIGRGCYNILSVPRSRQYKRYLKQSKFRKILFNCKNSWN